MSNKPNWEQIKEEYERGESLSVLAQTYGVKANTIKGRKQREKWKRNGAKAIEAYTDIEKFIYGFGYDIDKLKKEIFQKTTEELTELKKISIINKIALGVGIMRKVTVTYNSNGKIVKSTVTNIQPSKEEIEESKIMLKIFQG